MQEDQELNVSWVWGQPELHGEPVVRASRPETEKILWYYKHPSRFLIISRHFMESETEMFSYVYSQWHWDVWSRIKLHAGPPHPAGRLLHQLPLAFFWVAFHFLGRGSLVGRDRPFPLASVRLLCSLGCQHAANPIPRLFLLWAFPFLSVEEEFQEKYQKPHSQGDVISPLLLSQFPKPVDEVGVGGEGKSGGEWGWVVGRVRGWAGGWVSAVLLWKLDKPRVTCFYSVPCPMLPITYPWAFPPPPFHVAYIFPICNSELRLLFSFKHSPLMTWCRKSPHCAGSWV